MSLYRVTKCVGEMPDKMNFGCGNTIMSGYVNVDISISANLNIKEDDWVLEGNWEDPHEFNRDQFSEILARDVLEHFHPDTIANILYCFYCSMKVGGMLTVVVPDFENMAKIILELSKWSLDLKSLQKFRQLELDWMAPYIHNGVGHQSIWTEDIAKYRIEREGFEVRDMNNTIENSLIIKAVKI